MERFNIKTFNKQLLDIYHHTDNIFKEIDIDTLKRSVNIVDVISARLDIQRYGSNIKAKCPFHNEKTASFTVSESKQIFKCFGCGVSGDVITFIEMYHNCDFKEAIKILKNGG